MLRVFPQRGKRFRLRQVVELRNRRGSPPAWPSPSCGSTVADLRSLPFSGRRRGLQAILPGDPGSLWHHQFGAEDSSRSSSLTRTFFLESAQHFNLQSARLLRKPQRLLLCTADDLVRSRRSKPTARSQPVKHAVERGRIPAWLYPVMGTSAAAHVCDIYYISICCTVWRK